MDVAKAATLNKSGEKREITCFSLFIFLLFFFNEFMFSKSGPDSVESVDDDGSADVDWRRLKPDKHIEFPQD